MNRNVLRSDVLCAHLQIYTSRKNFQSTNTPKSFCPNISVTKYKSFITLPQLVTSTDWHNVAVFKPSLRTSVEQNVTKGDFWGRKFNNKHKSLLRQRGLGAGGGDSEKVLDNFNLQVIIRLCEILPWVWLAYVLAKVYGNMLATHACLERPTKISKMRTK